MASSTLNFISFHFKNLTSLVLNAPSYWVIKKAFQYILVSCFIQLSMSFLLNIFLALIFFSFVVEFVLISSKPLNLILQSLNKYFIKFLTSIFKLFLVPSLNQL